MMLLFTIENIISELIKSKKIIIFLILLPTIISFALPPEPKKADTMLARIGEKSISVDEFVQRTELSIRHPNLKSKNSILNNLISEKILALEAKKNADLRANSFLEGTIKGIKEQYMRDKLFTVEADNKVQLTNEEILNIYKASTREYELEFYTIKDDELAREVEGIIDSVPELSDDLFKQLSQQAGKVPMHRMTYFDLEDDKLHEALYTTKLDTGSVIGPIKISDGSSIVMKVRNWIDVPVIATSDQQERWKKVSEKLHAARAKRLWGSFVAGIMKGKKIEFEAESFRKISDLAYEYYLRNAQKDSLESFRIQEIPVPQPVLDPEARFFTLDNKDWTIADFKKELASHPLVFRTNNLTKNNFDAQFKFAVVDMMRDYYVSREAYARSFDSSEDVARKTEMWQDSFIAVLQQKNVINKALEEGAVKKNDEPGKLKFWESYLQDLQNKYSSQIKINSEELEKIKITNVNFFAYRPGVPYPAALPAFPVLIISDNLNYVKKN